MKRLISSVLLFLLLSLYATTSFAQYWDYDKGDLILTEEEEQAFWNAVEEKRRDPADHKEMPEVYPAEYIERLSFTIDVKGKHISSFLSSIAGKGDEITAFVYLTRGSSAWTLSLKGQGGTARLLYYLPINFGGYNYSTGTDRVLKFEMGYMFEFNDEDFRSEIYRHYDHDVSERFSDKIVFDRSVNNTLYAGTVYISGDPMNGNIDNLKVWMPFESYRGTSPNDGHFPEKVDDYQYDVLNCRNVKYEYLGDDMLNDKWCMYKLLGISTDLDYYYQELRRRDAFEKEHAYDHGPKSNYKTPLKWTEYIYEGGENEFDAYINGTTIAPMPPLISSMIPSMSGIGIVSEMRIHSIVETRNSEKWDSCPMIELVGERGSTAWFDIGTFAPNSDDPSSPRPNNPKAIYLKMSRIKDFKDLIKYEDLTKTAETFELFYYFTDESKDELDHMTLRYKTSTGKTEEITIQGSRLTYEGDPEAFRGWWNSGSEETDYFGEYLDRMGIEWR